MYEIGFTLSPEVFEDVKLRRDAFSHAVANLEDKIDFNSLSNDSSDVPCSILIGKEKESMVLLGFLYNSLSNYLIIQNDRNESIEIDDTLLRSRYVGKRVKITIQEI